MGDGPTQVLDDIPEMAVPAPVKGAWGRLVSLNTKTAMDVALVNDSNAFGRAASCDFVYHDQGISGKHCRIFREHIGDVAPNIWIEDNRSVVVFSIPLCRFIARDPVGFAFDFVLPKEIHAKRFLWALNASFLSFISFTREYSRLQRRFCGTLLRLFVSRLAVRSNRTELLCIAAQMELS